MAWDKALPAGGNPLKVGDDDIRANNIALESALDSEHEFATGGAQTGVHSLMIDSLANVTIASGSKPNGWIAFVNDVASYGTVAYIKVGGSLIPLDVYQDGKIPRSNLRSAWTASQFTQRVVMTGSSVGGYNQYTPDLSAGNYFLLTVTANSKIMLPSNSLGANYNTTYLVEVNQDGTGRDVLFESGHISVGGVRPTISKTANSKSLVQVTKIIGTTQCYQVSVLPDIRVFA